MITYEDHCVGCPPELGCLGESCPHKNVPVSYCDLCGDYADYRVDEKDYCEQCLREQMKCEFDGFTTEEMLEGFGYVWERVSELQEP